MGDSSFTDPAANAPDAAAYEKGKGKATEQDPTAQEMSMDEDESSEESGPEELAPEEDEEEGDNLEPISTDNIIEGGRRTRGKRIDFAEAAEKAKAAGDDEMDDSDDDEDFEAPDEDSKMEH
ncbi:hypothetical protein DTO166G4_3391 [Paecilomyces variotii]|uniref:Histone chaperone domain CHZ-domain-containing protein n=1 Tax=Byssochlamys spectabilis TaxID=264951 RepID=A0A443HTF0_BYSSP|nr:histone chaperone domain CHZ-domain-containing protein [Paecilomyces variotii]KAJ9194290.1 hypothetical protein DTO164E3_7396 [Paecilomyces variotii]KAJ9198534.1 hypothetical protein DTO032I3_5419 [Paecilomyces variotii]KAJ9214993.1 hypothetical protein DTO166G4_3391 [Paecilomyces variotii]KAJ9227592.1 hypothetical protein DTO169C6_233 [Paecilomyces variotii]KAJ9236707.1 hypothetical protein DTO166G5_3934 [Paecilomyces variotii]